MLSAAERSSLLLLARRAVSHAAAGEPLPPFDLPTASGGLLRPVTAFVTLSIQGVLRGCIGGLEARTTLAEDVWRHAYGAARDDPRFPPLRADELDAVHIEISCLTPPRRLDVPPEEIPSALQAGSDGVILRRGVQRATFLPQVWEKIGEPELFLDALSDKAGLPRSAWRRGEVEVLTYQVESFEED